MDVLDLEPFRGGISFVQEPLTDLVALVALDDDLSVFYRAACAAMRFQLFAELFEVFGGARETFDQGDGFAGALFGVQSDLKFLLFGGQRLFGGLFFLDAKIGVGGVDDAVAIGFLFAHAIRFLRFCFRAFVFARWRWGFRVFARWLLRFLRSVICPLLLGSSPGSWPGG